jgi:hypothetical protein
MDALDVVRSYLAGVLREWQELRLAELAYRHRDVALIAAIGLVVLPAFCACVRLLGGRRPGREAVVLPAIIGLGLRPRFAVARHVPLLLFLAGLPLFAFALTDPYTSLRQQDVAFPGRRIAVMIDASSSMMAKFPAARLATKQEVQNTFFTTVAAAQTFINQRIRGKYRDLISLIEFGDQAYVVTPFTNDYDNILLSLSLIGDWTEFQKFPDTGTTIGAALDEAVRLFRSFDFLNASGNLILIFSDGQDSEVSSRGVTISQLLRGAAQAKIPIFFIRVAYNRHEGDIIPDGLWRSAVESTGGRFFAGSDETSILRAINEIDRLGAGSVQVKQYTSAQPRYASFTFFAAALWLAAAALKVAVPYFQKFP